MYTKEDDDLAAAWLNENDVGTLDDCFMIRANGLGRRSLARLIAQVRENAECKSKGEATMDPNETLRRMRELTRKIVQDSEESEDAVALAEYVEVIDTWITKGGFLPSAWAAGRQGDCP